jgi:hypothetical protein
MQKRRGVHQQEFAGATQSRELDGRGCSPGASPVQISLLLRGRKTSSFFPVNNGKGFVDFLTQN